MWPASHSACSRTSSTWTGRSLLVQLLDREPRDARDRQLLLAPAREAAGQEAAEVRDARRRRQGRRRGGRRASSRPTRMTGFSRSAIQASFEPKPARSAVMLTERGTCASSYWSSVRMSTTSAPSFCACWTWRGVSGWTSTASTSSGPRLRATMFSKFGGCGGRPAIAFSTNASCSAIWSMGECCALEPDRRGHLQVHPGPAAQRPAEVAGPYLARVGERSAASRAASGRCRARPRSCPPPGRDARCRPRRACRPSGPPTARRPRSVSISANAVCSGRWPGVWIARTRTLPSSSSQPSSNGSWS